MKVIGRLTRDLLPVIDVFETLLIVAAATTVTQRLDV